MIKNSRNEAWSKKEDDILRKIVEYDLMIENICKIRKLLNGALFLKNFSARGDNNIFEIQNNAVNDG